MASEPLFQSAKDDDPAGSRAAAGLGRLAGIRFGRLAGIGRLAEAGLVFGGILILTLLLAPVAWLLGGGSGAAALVLAAGASLLGAMLALAVGGLFHGPQAPMYGMLAGMLARMSVALVLVLAVKRGLPDLAGAELVFYLLIFYLLALAIETLLAVARIRPDGVVAKPDAASPAFPKAV